MPSEDDSGYSNSNRPPVRNVLPIPGNSIQADDDNDSADPQSPAADTTEGQSFQDLPPTPVVEEQSFSDLPPPSVPVPCTDPMTDSVGPAAVDQGLAPTFKVSHFCDHFTFI